MPYLGNQHIVGDSVRNFKVLDDISSFTATFDGSATSVVSTSNNTIRIINHRFVQGQRVVYSNGGGGNIGGLSANAYYIIKDSPHTFKLAANVSDAASLTAINLSSVGTGSSHTLRVSFDGVNKKFKATHSNGNITHIHHATQLSVSINNVPQRPNDSLTFSEGFAVENKSIIVFQQAPIPNDIFFGSAFGETLGTFDISDLAIDNYVGDGSTDTFTLSKIPPNGQSILVTLNGVVQHAGDAATPRSYSLVGNVITFTAPPALGVDIQIRHLGFAGASTNGVTGFYGRSGNVSLSSSDFITIGDIKNIRNINASGIITATQFSGPIVAGAGSSNVVSGIITASSIKIPTLTDNRVVIVGTGSTLTDSPNLTFDGSTLGLTGSANISGNLSVGGVLTYEDVKNVDSIGLGTFRDGVVVKTGTATTALIVEGNARVTGIMSVGTGTVVIDETTVKTGTSNLHSVGIEIAGINVLGADTPIGAGSTIYNSGDAIFVGVVTASKFVGDISEAEGGNKLVFLGFKRSASGNLLLDYSTSGDSSTYNTEDYEHRGGAQWLMADTPHIHNANSLAAIGSTTRPDGSSPEVGQPKYRFIPSGHLIINI